MKSKTQKYSVFNTAFYQLKLWICNALLKTTLAYNDYMKPIVFQTDASEYNLGASQIHNVRPIAFMSKILTDVERR